MRAKKITPLRALRMGKKQSLRTVAQAVKVDPGHLSDVETRKHQASPALAERLAKHFGHSITELQILYPDRYMTKG